MSDQQTFVFQTRGTLCTVNGTKLPVGKTSGSYERKASIVYKLTLFY
ncbi:hypothetical protein AZZ82_002664 [Klebsiella aerogenes]|nr:hypothetical protein AZZ82_002664 [Klebsiella aerogenes]